MLHISVSEDLVVVVVVAWVATAITFTALGYLICKTQKEK